MKEIKDTYEPITASLRQDIEAFLANRKYIKLHYFNEIHEYISDTAIIKKVLKRSDGEYLFLSNGQEVRLDRIVRLDGKPVPGYDVQDFTCDC